MRVLVTRPLRDARQTAARLAALGHEAAIDPLIEIEAAAFELPAGPYAALTVTSANAVRATAGHPPLDPLRVLPLFAVGEKSGAAARDAGFGSVMTADGDARSLARMLGDRLAAGSHVLYLAGADRARDLAALTASAGIKVETVVVYRATAAGRLSAETAALLRGNAIDAVLHYSRRSAAAFAALAGKEGIGLAGSRPRHLCLSAAVAMPLREAGAEVRTASRPDETALFALLDP